MELSTILQYKVIEFLKSLPNIDETKSRRAFIYSIGIDSQLKDQIHFDEPPAQFVPLLVSTLVNYGRLKDGRYALETVIEAAKNYVGQDKQKNCDALIREISINRNVLNEFPQATHSEIISSHVEPEFRYFNLFQLSSIILPYVVIIGSWEEGINEYQRADVASKTRNEEFQLPDEFQSNQTPVLYNNEAKCRLLKFDCEIMPRDYSNRLIFTFSKITYLDYLMSGEHLDSCLPNDSNKTFRDKYASSIELHDFSKSSLTNICGVGIFIITRDEKIIISRSSKNVMVYGDIWSYSASGTMDWNNNVHPFHEIYRECYEEIGYKINIDDIYLFGFGVDTKKLYFQFTFFEYSRLSANEILAKTRLAQDFHAEMEEVIAIPFELATIINLVKQKKWEPAAAAGLLMLCTKKFGIDTVEKQIDPKFVETRLRKEMESEWERRALRKGDAAVMSARYPSHLCKEESRKYIQSVIEFIANDVDGTDVLEIGSGIGRLTEWLALRAGKLTCIDISKGMIQRNKQRIGSLSQKVTYLQMFAQDYHPEQKHDIAISSLVLIHSLDEITFQRVVRALSLSARTIFLFEHTDVSSQVSSYTQPRSKEELISAFAGFEIEKQQTYKLFNDNLIFLKLIS